ncbi:MAG TPA: molybdopterin cofactor-binding domain-containing protein, partial [Vicinamibacteria bacterium]|nr:molybdopterin cofactor-binding domain-containing protein [Vicinamibacteria bacterium]
LRSIGRSERRVDSVKLATGRGTFVDDVAMPGLLHAKILRSPHAHARIARIDAAHARAMPGVAAVLTHEDVPRVPYTTAGQGWPEPSPYDSVMLDHKVRFVGDRVAVVAAEDPEIARRACDAIKVEYEVLPAVLDPEHAMAPGAPVIHDQTDASGIRDAQRNLAAEIVAEVGRVEDGFAAAEKVLEGTYRVGYVQQSSIEPHITITWLDEDNRLVVRTSTQVPFHVRRIIAPLLDLPIRRIRVIKPRVGGGFGGKQEILIEDLCGMVTLRTGRPCRLEYTREEELTAARTRHPQAVTVKSGVRDGRFTALEMRVLENTGAYGTHALTVMSVTGNRALSLYRCPNLRYTARAVYTNLAVAGAFRGYGCPQGFFALESHIDEVCAALGEDPLEFRARNHVREGDDQPIAQVLGEGREGFQQIVRSCGLPEAIRLGARAIGWSEKRAARAEGPLRQGVGMAIVMQASGIPGVDMGAASLKMNEDGSFNLLVGATDIGTGADTMFCQVAAEALGVPVEKIIPYSSDTDMTPFDPGAYASSTTYISGRAVQKAALEVRRQITEVGARLLEEDAADVVLHAGKVCARDGRHVTYEQVCLSSLYQRDQFQIMATASHMSYDSPPPFAAVFAEVEVDVETGLVRVLKLVEAVDCGQVVNPSMAEGQVEGAAVQSLGYGLYERMPVDAEGRMQFRSFRDYTIATAADVPEIVTILVPTHEPTGPFGAKAVAEIPINGPAPAIANAVFHATGARLRELPLTPDRVLAALRERAPR